MRRIVLSFVLVIAALPSFQREAAAKEKCLKYVPEAVTLSGSLRQHVDIEDWSGANPKPVPHLRLHLDRSICVDGNVGEDSPEADGERNVRQLQLFVGGGDTGAKSLVGHRVKVTGTLFHQILFFHHTRVLIDVEKIEKLR